MTPEITLPSRTRRGADGYGLRFLIIASLIVGCDASSVHSAGWDPICGAAPESRWSADVTLEESFGDIDGELWFEDVFGVAATGDDVWALDQGRGLVRISDGGIVADLTREGSGPGELRLGQAFGGDWIAVAGEAVVTFDGWRFSWFGLDGTFREGAEGVAGVDPFLTDRIAPSPQGVWAGRVETENDTGARTLRIVEVGRNGRTRELRFTMPPLPRVDGRYVPVVLRQALPSWYAEGPCVYVTDGSQLLLRVHVGRNQWDTLLLPEWELPPIGEADRQALRSIAAFSPSLSYEGLIGAEPTRLARWSDLRVDPDGHVWLKRWESRAAEAEDDRVLMVDGDGNFEDRRVTRFPDAFGPNGGLVSVRMDDPTGAPIVDVFHRRDR